jgi:Ca2+-binding EF-hand superfamily protein
MTMFSRLTAAALLTFVSAPALAQPEVKSDAEKAITKDEISAKLDADYADMDADKDGKVTAAEIDARLVKSAEAKVEEIKKERDAAFAKLDANGDGNISRAEFDEKAKLPTIKKPDPAPFLAKFDADKDGAITLEEFRGPTLANFAEMDRDHDGTVTPAEVSLASNNTGGPARTATGTAARTATGTAATTTPAKPAKKPTFKNTPSISR